VASVAAAFAAVAAAIAAVACASSDQAAAASATAAVAAFAPDDTAKVPAAAAVAVQIVACFAADLLHSIRSHFFQVDIPCVPRGPSGLLVELPVAWPPATYQMIPCPAAVAT